MPINPLIPLSTTNTVDTVSRIENINRNRELLDVSNRRENRLQRQSERVDEETVLRDAGADSLALLQAIQSDQQANNNFSTSRQLIADRHARLVEGGRDTRHTDTIGALMNEGRIDDVKGLLSGVVNEVAGRGLIRVPAGQEGFTLAPGAARFDSAGNEIVRNPSRESGPGVLVSLVSPEGERRSLRRGDQEVDRLVAQGWTVAPARTTEVPFQTDAPPIDPPAPSTGESLFNRAETGTGPQSAVGSFFTTLGAIAGLSPSEKGREIVRSRQALELASSNLIRSLSINPRFPVGEINRIQREVQIQPGFFDAPEIMQERMREIDVGLRRRMQQAEADATNPGLPGEVREAQRANSQSIRNFLSDLGVPQELTDEQRQRLQQLRSEQNAAQ